MYFFFAALLLFVPTFLFCQTDADTDADSLVRGYEALFDTGSRSAPPAPADESGFLTSPLASDRVSGITIFPNRLDLLRLQDSPPFFIKYDRADGAFAGVGSNTPARLFSAHRLQGYAGFGYAFGSHTWQAYGGISGDLLSEEAPLRLAAEGHVFTDTRDAWKMECGENTLYALLAGVDTRDYYRRQGFSIGARQFLTSRISLKAEYRFDTYRNSHREAGWSLFGPTQPFPEVPPIREGAMHSAVVGLAVDYMALRSWDQARIGFEAQGEFGSLGGNFQQYTADARLKATILRERLWLGLRGRLGIAAGNAPPQKRYTIGGLGTLPGFPQNRYEGNRLLLLQSDLLFAPITSLGFRLILENAIGYVGTAPPSAAALTGFPAELVQLCYAPGIYIGSATGRFRAGIAFRTDIMADPEVVVRLSEPF